MSSLKIQRCYTFTVNGVDYAAWPKDDDCVLSDLVLEHEILVTIIRLKSQETPLSLDWLQNFIPRALAMDDVFQTEFLSGIILLEDEGISATVDKDAVARLEQYGNKFVQHSNHMQQISGQLAPGLYLLSSGALHEVYRLYEDNINAFVQALRSDSLTGRCLPLDVRIAKSIYGTVAVPSRLRQGTEESETRPLQGLRFTCKDMFEIQGLRETLGSRAYFELGPVAQITAPAIQKLVDQGAHLIGLSQMCPMVGTAPPTQCVDFASPINPRGDQYQSPSGGSSGQASAVAAYDWLDIAVGSDSTVSGRVPAQVNGCFSLRPSGGLVSTVGMWSGVPYFDTPCIFGRDISLFNILVKSWYGEHLPLLTKNLSRTIIFPVDFLPTENIDQMKVLNDFIKDLESFTGISATRVSIADLWMKYRPLESEGMSIKDYLNEDIASRTYVYTFWQKIQDFLEDYRAKFKKEPFMPPPRGINLWDAAKDVTTEMHQYAQNRLKVYAQWLTNVLLQAQDQDPIVIMPLRNVEPSYRDEWPRGSDKAQQLWEPLLFAPILGAPECVVPSGHVSYVSRISGRVENLPVAISVMGMPGSDLRLIDLVQRFLKETGRPTKVSTGRFMFDF